MKDYYTSTQSRPQGDQNLYKIQALSGAAITREFSHN